jgi:hypothetical protein
MDSRANIGWVKLFEEPVRIDWSTHGDELLSHMREVLGEKVSVKSWEFHRHTPTDEDPYFYLCRPISNSLTSELALVPATDGFHAYARFETGSVDSLQIELWTNSITEAVVRLNQPHPTHEWSAYIGPVGEQMSGTQRIVQGFRVAGLTANPATSEYIDVVRQQIPSLAAGCGAGADLSFPVKVDGNSQGYDWHAALELVNRDLNRLCAILSVAFNANWMIRHAPNLKVFFGEFSLPAARFDILGRYSNSDLPLEDLTAPSWLEEAWQRLDQDEALATSLHAYHQGLGLEETVPSFALVAYVGSIESLGSILDSPKPCETCQNVPGAARRFRNALKLVLSPKDAQALYKQVYPDRSKTAHEGRLHGGEITGEARYITQIFTHSTSDEFCNQVVRRVRQTNRMLLRHFLRGDKS